MNNNGQNHQLQFNNGDGRSQHKIPAASNRGEQLGNSFREIKTV
jgi:hypothetical protein